MGAPRAAGRCGIARCPDRSPTKGGSSSRRVALRLLDSVASGASIFPGAAHLRPKKGNGNSKGDASVRSPAGQPAARGNCRPRPRANYDAMSGRPWALPSRVWAWETGALEWIFSTTARRGNVKKRHGYSADARSAIAPLGQHTLLRGWRLALDRRRPHQLGKHLKVRGGQINTVPQRHVGH